MCRFYGSHTLESWLTSYQISAYLIRRSGEQCHRLYVLELLSDIVQNESYASLATARLCSYEQQLHRVDAHGRDQRDWVMDHAPYIALWDTRAGRIITASPMVGIMDFHDPYMQ